MPSAPPPLRRIGILGFGYVGRAVAHAFAGEAEVVHHDPASPQSLPLAEVIRGADVLFVCVPTPQGTDGRADLRIVDAVLADLAHRSVTAPIVLKSTVTPGSTQRWADAYPHLSLTFSPEFLRQAHHLHDAAQPVRVVLGWTAQVPAPHRDALTAWHAHRFPDVPCIASDATTAELLKYASNALFGVKVSFANELAEMADHLGVDWSPIRDALVLDPRIGHDHLQVPGPDGQRGFGGDCLPKDMAALVAFAEQEGLDLDVVAAALSANARRRQKT